MSQNSELLVYENCERVDFVDNDLKWKIVTE